MKTICRLLATALLVGSLGSAFALAPPRPGEVARLKQQGVWAERVASAKQLGNQKLDINLARRAAQRAADLAAGKAPGAYAPPSARVGLPTVDTDPLDPNTGPNVLVLLVDFPDATHDTSQTRADVESKMFGTGDTSRAPYDSVTSYYSRSSYEKLHLRGTVKDWFTAANPRAYYKQYSVDHGAGTGESLLLDELMANWDATTDFAPFDNNGVGNIDAIFVKWTGADDGWAGFWWPRQLTYTGTTAYDSKLPTKIVWSWYGNGTLTYFPDADIHETGHLLGLPDLYDYDSATGIPGGVGGLDMMDSNWGDHNAFSKFMLDWLTPTVVATSETLTKTLSPSGSTAHAVMVMPGASTGSLFSEYYLAQYRKRGVGNDPVDYPADGLVIWHVDATLNVAGTDFKYNNSDTAHKLLRLMEADGLEELESGARTWADAGDYYTSGSVLTPSSSPNSENYAGNYTGVTINGIGTAGDSITATFNVTALDPAPYVLTVTKAGTGVGTVTSSPSGINCGYDCVGSFAGATTVTLTAAVGTNSVFSGWTGDCTGTSTVCTVTIDAAKAVTATFDVPNDGFPNVESGLPAGWVQPGSGSAAPWVVDTDSSYQGTSSLRSGAIADSQASILSYTGTFLAGNVSFARRVSSEVDFDMLRFYIDDVEQAVWSGDQAWAMVSYPVAAGTHTLKWSYSKDVSAFSGSDAAWIDAVTLPPVPSVVGFTSASTAVNKRAGQVILTVRRTTGSVGTLSVNYATSAGTALAGTDFVATSGTLSWADGETSDKTITVTILNNASARTVRQFTVNLSAPTNGASLSVSSETVKIATGGLGPALLLLFD